MNTDNFTAITEALFHLVTNKAPLQVILRNINQFAIALIPAETCTTWIRDGEDIIVGKDTAYPLCYTQSVGSAAIQMKEGRGVGLTAYMAYQFATNTLRYEVFNLSYATIVGHTAYGGGKPANLYFPTSTTALSILCAPLRRESTNELLGMVKIENKLSPLGFPSGEAFVDDEVKLAKQYVDILANKILSSSTLDLAEVRSLI